MSEPDCTIEASTAQIDAYLEGMIEGNSFADDLDSLITLSQKLKRDLTCVVTVKYVEIDQPSEDNQ